MSGYSPAWLDLREGADTAARAAELLDQLPARDHWDIRDLGCGTGAMARWLAGRLPGPQHWVLYDRDPALLDHAAATAAGTAADGAQVTAETRQRDITALPAGELTGAGLVTASALLDLLTAEEVDRLAAACVEAACPALLTLSVVGDVELSPADPLDAEIADAFNAHQRRRVEGRRLLGPDAVDAAAEAFTSRGAAVLVRPSPWRLGPAHAELLREWLRGWVAAAYEQRPQLGTRDGGYLERRIAAAAAGELRAVVGHRDLLATPGMNRRHPADRRNQR